MSLRRPLSRLFPSSITDPYSHGRHHITVLPVYIIFSKQDWIPLETKVRLLEWKIRLDLLKYPTHGCPEFSLDKIMSYTPKDKGANPERGKPATSCDAGMPTIFFPWLTSFPPTNPDLVARVHALDHEDGHAIKLLRAVVVGRQFTRPFRGQDDDSNSAQLQLRDDAVYDKLLHLVADAVESDNDTRWVRGAGYADAWKVGSSDIYFLSFCKRSAF